LSRLYLLSRSAGSGTSLSLGFIPSFMDKGEKPNLIETPGWLRFAVGGSPLLAQSLQKDGGIDTVPQSPVGFRLPHLSSKDSNCV
jgi:hypothetical protein